MALLIPFPGAGSSRVSGHSWAGRFLRSALLIAGAMSVTAQGPPSREYQVKAVFLFHFTEFVDWPSGSFSQDTTPLVIGVLGEDPFGAYLDEVVRGETVRNRPLVVQRYRRAEDIRICHVLYISPASADQVKEVSERLKGRSVLTVGETQVFARSGGMIGFATVGGKLRLMINVEAARESHLVISSKLLRTAEIISPGRR